MTDIVSNLAGRLGEPQLSEPLQVASRELTELVEDSAYVGEVYSLGYDEALVQIHDFHRQQVGGIPALSFLVATRVSPSILKGLQTLWLTGTKITDAGLKDLKELKPDIYFVRPFFYGRHGGRGRPGFVLDYAEAGGEGAAFAPNARQTRPRPGVRFTRPRAQKIP